LLTGITHNIPVLSLPAPKNVAYFCFNNSLMKLFSFIPPFFRNKFLLATIAFSVWMIFFDKNDVLLQRQRKQELQNLEKSKTFFAEQIEQERTFSENLKMNPATIEKFAREKYMMKRDNEDLYIIQPAAPEEK
jgi:cell division protein FtsB